MAIITESLCLETAHGPVKAYAALPSGERKAVGVVVIHEIWGVDAHIRSVVDRFALAGHPAIAPDLIGFEVTVPPSAVHAFFRGINQVSAQERAQPERIAEVSERIAPEHRKQVQALVKAAFQGLTKKAEAGLTAAVDYLHAHEARKVATVGFCMGGALAWGFAYAGGNADGAVIFYGRPPQQGSPERAHGPLLGHFGGLDAGIPVSSVEAAAAAMRAAGCQATIHVYPEAPHAFFNDARDAYRPDDAALAWDRTLLFLDRL